MLLYIYNNQPLQLFIDNYLAKENIKYKINNISIKKLFTNIDEIILYYTSTMNFLFDDKKRIKLPISVYDDLINVLYNINKYKDNFIFLTNNVMNLYHENNFIYFTNENDYKKWKLEIEF